MHRHHLLYAAAIAIVGLAVLPGSARGQAGEHKLITPQEMQWGSAPPSVPPGAQATVMDGLFAFRLKFPNGYHIAPHTHPKPEVVTVISGTVRLGMGEAADRGKAQVLPAGSFFALSPGLAHYLFADEESVVQINSTGPWGISYLNPKDDPRAKTQ